jgi:hypothetical protein
MIFVFFMTIAPVFAQLQADSPQSACDPVLDEKCVENLGTGHSINVRDYHIGELESRF